MRFRGLVLAAISASVLASPAWTWAQPFEPPPDQPPPPPPVEPGPPCVAPCFDQILHSDPASDRFGTLGVRVGTTQRDASAVSVAFAGRASEYKNIGITNDRATIFWVLGGGGAGFEGALGGSAAGGLRLPFDPVQGVVFRVGFEGYILGNKLLYASMFEIPQGQVAYQFAQNAVLFEVGAKTGAVLTGRYRDPTNDAVRKYPISAEWGGYTSLHFTPLRFDASYTRIETRGDAIGTPIDVLDGDVCGLTGPIALCVDARFQRGAVTLEGGGDKTISSAYGGVTLGFRNPHDKHDRHEKKKAASASTTTPVEP